MWKNWSGTARRLLIGFGALALITGLTSWLTMAGLARIQRGIAWTKDEEESVRQALELASAVRDQYAHQAHTIIIGDRSHMQLYAEAEQHVLELTRALRSRVRGADEVAWVDRITRSSAELDTIFREHIVPAVLRGDRRYVQDEHARAQLAVSDIQEASERLIARFEARIAAERASATGVERRTRRGVLIVLVAAPLVAALVLIVVGRSISRPMERLRAGAARIGDGDLTTRIEFSSRDEFGALADQFNAMASALAHHQAELVRSEKLASVGRLAAGVAHEINNPLAVILGYARLLRKRSAPEAAADLAVIEEETLRCKEIVEGLLDLSRPVQAGRERVDLRAAIDLVVARLREARQLEGVEVHVQGDAAVRAHPSKLRQVLANLLRNAGEAAGPGGQVWVAVELHRDRVCVSVRDSGQGLDGRARGRLFEPFFTTKERGTGLGLAISRSIARAHGGDLEAESPGAGGATFTLRLPALVGGA